MVISSALNSGGISRLKKTWDLVDKKYLSQYEENEELLSGKSNFKNLRKQMATSPLPCLPFMGVYLTDLVFLNENPNEIDGLINYVKMQQIGNIISTFRNFQVTPYNFTNIERLLDEYILFKHESGAVYNENQAFERSKEIEPLQTK
jgi:hypothetical protein